MKNKRLVLTLVFALAIGLAFLYIPFPKKEIPKGFALVDVLYHGSNNRNITVL